MWYAVWCTATALVPWSLISPKNIFHKTVINSSDVSRDILYFRRDTAGTPVSSKLHAKDEKGQFPITTIKSPVFHLPPVVYANSFVLSAEILRYPRLEHLLPPQNKMSFGWTCSFNVKQKTSATSLDSWIPDLMPCLFLLFTHITQPQYFSMSSFKATFSKWMPIILGPSADYCFLQL